MTRRPKALGAGLALLSLAPGCVAPAFTQAQYEAKVKTTAEAALSALETMDLAVMSLRRHDVPRAPIEVAVSDAEDVLGSVSGTFASIQPPGEPMDELRSEVMTLLDEAEDHAAEARIALRRGDIAIALDEISATRPVAEELDGIVVRL